MPFPVLSRRSTLKIGAFALAGLNIHTMARSALAANGSHYFVPACRIGFVIPEGVEVATDVRRLMSGDHCFSIDVREQSHRSQGYDYVWDKDNQSSRVPPSIDLDGFDIREFRYLGYGDDVDYSRRSIVLRDAHWTGEIEISTSDLDLPSRPPEGQVAHWRGRTAAVFASITIRAQPQIEQALAELGIRFDAPHLHPRIIDQNLILSLAPLHTDSHTWGTMGPSIRAASLMDVPRNDGTDVLREELVQEQVQYTRAMTRKAGFEPEVIRGPHVHGVLSAELEFMEGSFSTTLHLIGPNRFFDLTAYYDAQSREPILAALHSIVDRIEFIAPT